MLRRRGMSSAASRAIPLVCPAADSAMRVKTVDQGAPLRQLIVGAPGWSADLDAAQSSYDKWVSPWRRTTEVQPTRDGQRDLPDGSHDRGRAGRRLPTRRR